MIPDDITIDSTYEGLKRRADDSWLHAAWSVTLTYAGRTFTIPFNMGTGLVGEPERDDVCLALADDYRYGQADFDDFCAELGYDTDSRKAYAQWEACKHAAERLERWLGADLQAFLEYPWEG